MATTISTDEAETRTTRRGALRAGAAVAVAPAATPLTACIAGSRGQEDAPLPAEGPATLLPDLEAQLRQRIVGQEEAVTAVAATIRRSRSGLADPRRPMGSFLFLGPTGVGKTALARALAELVFGDESTLLRLDMSEYQEPHTVSRLYGSPPGNVGYDLSGQLTEAVRRAYQVFLFDEIEHAHPEVLKSLLQIMASGRLTDDRGGTADFRNTLVIMTSNAVAAGLTLKRDALGAHPAGRRVADDTADRRTRIADALTPAIQPAFLNRIDELIVFNHLDRQQLRVVAEMKRTALQARAPHAERAP
ncbi:MAG: AAA family ATPase [Chloroflexota bacterium]